MTIEKIVYYVLHTPQNTNKAILIDMLEELIRTNGGTVPDSGEEVIYDGGTEGEGGSSGGIDHIYDGGMET